MSNKTISIDRLNVRVKGQVERSGREFGAAFGRQLLAQIASSGVLRDWARSGRVDSIDAGLVTSPKQAADTIAARIERKS